MKPILLSATSRINFTFHKSSFHNFILFLDLHHIDKLIASSPGGFSTSFIIPVSRLSPGSISSVFVFIIPIGFQAHSVCILSMKCLPTCWFDTDSTQDGFTSPKYNRINTLQFHILQCSIRSNFLSFFSKHTTL